MCVILPNFIKIGQTVTELWRFNGFQNGGRPPSWICWAPIGNTHDDFLMVSIVVQNFVEMDAVVSITWNFQYFARLAWQEAQLSSDRAMRLVSSNLASCHATVQKLLIRQVLTKLMVWSWRFSWRQCVMNNVHSTVTRPSRLPLSQVS